MAEFYRKKKKVCQLCAGKTISYKDDIIVDIIGDARNKSSKAVIECKLCKRKRSCC